MYSNGKNEFKKRKKKTWEIKTCDFITSIMHLKMHCWNLHMWQVKRKKKKKDNGNCDCIVIFKIFVLLKLQFHNLSINYLSEKLHHLNYKYYPNFYLYHFVFNLEKLKIYSFLKIYDTYIHFFTFHAKTTKKLYYLIFLSFPAYEFDNYKNKMWNVIKEKWLGKRTYANIFL